MRIQASVLLVLSAAVGVAATTLVPDASRAEEPTEPPLGIVLPAGQWDFKIKLTMPGESRPTVNNVSTCMKGGVVTPEALMPWLDDQGCVVADVEVEGSEMAWELECNLQGKPTRGKGKFEVEGEKAKGRSSINIRSGGSSVAMTTKWIGKRVGECPPPTPDA